MHKQNRKETKKDTSTTNKRKFLSATFLGFFFKEKNIDVFTKKKKKTTNKKK